MWQIEHKPNNMFDFNPTAPKRVAEPSTSEQAAYAYDSIPHRASLGWVVTSAQLEICAKAAGVVALSPIDTHQGLASASRYVAARRAKH